MKTTTKLKIAGFTLTILGVSLLLTSFIDFIISVSSIPTLFGLIFIGMPFLAIGISLLIKGFQPEITKIRAKVHSETMDYAGKNLGEAGIKTVEIASPIVNKAADAFSPAITKVTTAIKSSSSKTYCKHCGNPIEKDSKFCKYCGKEQ